MGFPGYGKGIYNCRIMAMYKKCKTARNDQGNYNKGSTSISTIGARIVPNVPPPPALLPVSHAHDSPGATVQNLPLRYGYVKFCRYSYHWWCMERDCN